MLARTAENSITLDVPLRGNRNYVHSTDLFAALDDLAGRFLAPRAYLKNFTLRRQARRQVAVQFTPHPDAFGTFALALPHQTLEGWLVEGAGAITRRVSFDESAIARQAVVEPGRVFLTAPVKGYSGFEQLIVLFKMLCAQSSPGAWRFTELDLLRPIADETPLGVSRSQMVLNRLLDGVLDQDGRPLGRVRMVLAPGGEGR